MRHKKKRSAPSQRNPDQLDYGDEPPLDSRKYQEAIRAHLNEFDDSASRQSKGMNGTHNDVSNYDHYSAHARPHQTRNVSANSEAHSTPSKPGMKSSSKHGQNTVDTNKDRIWNTTSNEERERIREFWLNLSVDERRSLIKVEKEAVLKKMKDQQKQSCSCSLCGRKRSAIEEELEIRYAVYYEELELYANQQQYPAQESAKMNRHAMPRMSNAPRHGKITEVLHSDDEGSLNEDEVDDLSEDDLLTEDDLSDEYEDELYSDDEEEEYVQPERPIPEFLEFGSSLKVKDGMLSVADDLLQNGGRRFIEMMEKLAGGRLERQKQAEEHVAEFDDADLDDDDLDEDDLDSEDQSEDDDYLNPDAEQKMEEGRRMFQIFIASMFEQRVLTAYREKVAQERQALLLQELELEDVREKEREAKKAKEKEKKKDKKRQQQLKKEEEKARKEAERLAEEAAQKAEEERKAEENRKRKEEQRLKREAEKKLLEAERLRKEDEKRKRIADDKAREAKRLEQLAKEKKAKEEAQRKERDAKAAAAKEAKLKSQAEKAQRESEKTAELPKNPPQHSSPQHPNGQMSHKISPPLQPSNNLPTAPAVPKTANTKDLSHSAAAVAARHYQESGHPTAPRNIPVPSSQQQRPMTPAALSPQQQQQPHQPFGSQQNSFPRAALGHPPSMPVPLPPPGIGAHNPAPIHHDNFGFNGQQQMQQNHIQNNPVQPRPMNGHVGGPMPGMQGPPWVFSTAPAFKPSTSPQSRIGTPLQSTRFGPSAPFPAFSGLGPGTSPREDSSHHEPELPAFSRRTSNLLDNNGPSPIGAIGRPSPARSSSIIPAPIQRPSAIAPPHKRNGLDSASDVLGSRALLDDDDPVVDERLGGSIFNVSGTNWNGKLSHNEDIGYGSAALNGTIGEPFQPLRNGSVAQTSMADRWGNAGPIGHKVVLGDERFPNHPPTKPATWGF